jgi:hypothetical protein
MSIEDQVRKCREFAESKGWKILEGHVYTDAAISAASGDRSGFKALLILSCIHWDTNYPFESGDLGHSVRVVF